MAEPIKQADAAYPFGWLAPTFVDGIGPPLEQLEEDYALDGDHDDAAKDLLALIAEVKRLRGGVAP